ncbi:MAG: hypothetical protein GXO35_04255 [Gammaproteobacteria bacterium]|nr:hypothetical protein [Gammaproteobacteria bacterium]
MIASLGALGKLVSRRLESKTRKHDQIRLLATSQLDSIADLVSMAIRDGRTSDEEFRQITEELRNYEQKKEEIRAGARKALDEETKHALIRRGRDEPSGNARRCKIRVVQNRYYLYYLICPS